MASFERASVPAWRVLIAGGGPAGLALALALVQALGPAIAVTICDPGEVRPDHRAFALSPASARMLDILGVWPDLRARAQPVGRMTITDSRLEDAIRPTYLTFAADATGPLAYMVPARDLADALAGAADTAGIARAKTVLSGFQADAAGLLATGADGTPRRAALLVAADGARSRLRDASGLAWLGRDYPQIGLVATLAHARDHGGGATQHFLPAGPFALLPLPPREGSALLFRSSLVWSEARGRVPELLALDPAALADEIARRAGPELGAIAPDSPLGTFPLSIGNARRVIAPRFALLGDAAHQIHPLAGHGLNLGFGDAAALAERIVDAVRLGLDPGGAAVLEGYARDRRAATLAMSVSTDLLNRLFSNDITPLRATRDIGLGLVDRSPALKRLFVGGATDGLGEGARLLQGRPL